MTLPLPAPSLPAEVNLFKGEDILLQFKIVLPVQGVAREAKISLRCIPDKHTVNDAAVVNWLTLQSTAQWPTADTFAAAVCTLFYDTVLPCYVDVRVGYKQTNGLKCEATVCKKQPGYHMPELLTPLL